MLPDMLSQSELRKCTESRRNRTGSIHIDGKNASLFMINQLPLPISLNRIKFKMPKWDTHMSGFLPKRTIRKCHNSSTLVTSAWGMFRTSIQIKEAIHRFQAIQKRRFSQSSSIWSIYVMDSNASHPRGSKTNNLRWDPFDYIALLVEESLICTSLENAELDPDFDKGFH